jgi:membrane-bound lytic murein transglycosylase D
MIETRINRLGLAVMALLFCLSASAAEPLAHMQSLEWQQSDTSSGTADSNTTTDSATSNSNATADGATPDSDTPADSETAAEVNQNDVWQRIRNGFKIDDAALKNPLVATQAAWYASHPDYVRRMLERSRRYLYHIVQEVDRRAMPTEIALLPMIESAFKSSALSSSAASGIWQFMPATARLYGLKQDSWYDGRRDFTAATDAALDYLGKLYLDFGDWQLALAAYNCGEGCVARAIQKNVDQGLPTDYASLPLPEETRNYVPKLLAIKKLIRNPEQFGISLDTLPNQPYFDQVVVRVSMDMHAAARLAGMSREEFIALNPAFPRNVIRSDSPVSLLLPVDKADKFQHNLETGVWDRWKPYAAKRGERIKTIARHFNVTVARLEEHNVFRLRRGKLVRAQILLVPVKSPGMAATQRTHSAPASADASEHQVQRGDTLFSVARRYGLTVTQLTAANPNLNGHLNAGQTLRLPSNEASRPDPAAGIRRIAFKPHSREPANPVHYTVKRGDTLHAIAQRFDISLNTLKSRNPIFRKSSHIRAGQRITIK